MKVHRLKCFPTQFEPIHDLKMKSTIRNATDRVFAIGDAITFIEGEHHNGEWIESGRTVSARISWIDNFGIQRGMVNISLDEVGMLVV